MAKIFLGQQTQKGRVVYKRKKHYYRVNDITRVLFIVANRYTVAEDPDYLNHMAPWKTIMEVARNEFQEAVARYERENPSVTELHDRLQIGLGPAGGDNEMNKIYNLFIDILDAVSDLSDYLGWIPFVGLVLEAEKKFWAWLRETLHIEKVFISQPQKTSGKKNK